MSLQELSQRAAGFSQVALAVLQGPREVVQDGPAVAPVIGGSLVINGTPVRMTPEGPGVVVTIGAHGLLRLHLPSEQEAARVLGELFGHAASVPQARISA